MRSHPRQLVSCLGPAGEFCYRSEAITNMRFTPAVCADDTQTWHYANVSARETVIIFSISLCAVESLWSSISSLKMDIHLNSCQIHIAFRACTCIEGILTWILGPAIFSILFKSPSYKLPGVSLTSYINKRRGYLKGERLKRQLKLFLVLVIKYFTADSCNR